MLLSQDGVASRTELLSLGMSRSSFETSCKSGELVRVLPAVYRASALPFSTAGQIRAAMTWAGDGAVLSGEAAAWWWHFSVREPGSIEISVPHTKRLRVPAVYSPIRIMVRRRTLAEQDVRLR